MITNTSLLPPTEHPEYPEPFWRDEWTSEPPPGWLWHSLLEEPFPWLDMGEHASPSGFIDKGQSIKERAEEEGDLFCLIHTVVNKAEVTFHALSLERTFKYLTAERPGPSWRSHIPPLGGTKSNKSTQFTNPRSILKD